MDIPNRIPVSDLGLEANLSMVYGNSDGNERKFRMGGDRKGLAIDHFRPNSTIYYITLSCEASSVGHN